ncbi:MAG: N-6 DNA methylase [Candidatus Delongbacteria bacterium]|nr:N-6 DNA methylase [Candidatus Delongbacteria bacterium]
MINKKHTGSYYTPKYLADFISKRVDAFFVHKNRLSLLEPSVGDGSFIESINNTFNKAINLTALDINSVELKKAKEKWNSNNAIFREIDFLNFKNKNYYDAIIGNPPYIKKNFLKESQVEACKEIHFNAELSEASVKNIWTAFLIKSSRMLNSIGVLAFVLPSELLQVKFAEEIREFLKREFQRIEIFTFNDLMFECKGQDTIVLFAYKKAKEKGEFFTNIKSRQDILQNSIQLKKNNLLVESKVKWTHHFLTESEISFLNEIKNGLNTVNHYSESKPGIVTAANKFFIVDKKTEKEYNLSSYTKPVIQKGLFVNGSVVFKEKDFIDLERNNYPTRLLQLNNSDKISKRLNEYLATGVELEIPQRYKCKIRDNWYVIPNISTEPEAFFFKRSHHYPKLLKNEANAFVTDSAYKVNIKEPYDLNSFIYSFYNSITLTFAEIDGRYYGGGVLELTPNEFKGLPIPYLRIENDAFDRFTIRFEQKDNIKSLLAESDNEILGTYLGLSRNEIERVQLIRNKLVEKRIRK